MHPAFEPWDGAQNRHQLARGKVVIFQCIEKTCQAVWAAFPTLRRTKTPTPRICPDCARIKAATR